ncbi:beta-ketoacyl-[acyl-carrier-protein] synthase family protein [Chitinophaga nivalis]|uniref:Beta-ketoacyl-[acyl-carrier-protein] synthase family protein n=1 Tax=Chitinophaga nivalis TaxID=2991709 RepID=A0ABT3IFP5_9BACT|nr:beta-ketoacyl-[acyl-carrier-protein] synthase family protein [Chitinophaga nivalis]MCW3467532.1 beta-ketoacyl-[acyl-carrier-protein] synthase family protein [Chitinophaga nivalis]MCW3482776.1 beta-ketoacyl-[acyl-carrier-protein] synthase family protein [Chitinophaga nivalis]
MSDKVWIAGGGVISGIGLDLRACLQAFRDMQPGMTTMQHLRSVHHNTFPVAEVKADNATLADMARMPEHISRTALLSLIAAREAWQSAGLRDISAYRVGFVSGNTVGGMDKTEDFFADLLTHPGKGRLNQVVHHECGSITELVADTLGIRHHISTISTACSSGANALMYGARLIRNNIVDVVIAGGTDSLTRFTLNGFNTLMILDQQPCRPFDDTRTGLNLGEGAGYVILVSDSLAAQLQPWCRLSGYANANDAYHQTASSPDGTGNYLAMKGALDMSGLQPQQIDYINLHGTGTQNNDISEGIAISRLFAPHFPVMSSTKSFTGHTLGASGGIEAVFSAMAVKEGIIYPNARFEHQMKELPFAPVAAYATGKPLQHVMSNSFGFGGNCSSLVFSKA